MAVGIAKISEIGAIRTDARRVLDRRAAVRDAGFVPRFGLRRILHHKPDRAAVSLAGRLAINRLGHHEPAAIVRVSQSASGVLSAGLSAHRGKQGIIEFLRPGDIVTPDHDVAKHSVLLLEKDKRSYDDVLAASGVGGCGRVDTGSMERPARDGA